jgi:hypothetical protein
MAINSDTLTDRTNHKRCSKCGASFICGPQADMNECWCKELPPLSPITDGSDCLCRACLSDRISTQPSRPAPQAMRPSALVEGEDYYLEGSAVVFTAKYHLRRGYCCGNGCRHCPYKELHGGTGLSEFGTSPFELDSMPGAEGIELSVGNIEPVSGR